MPLVFKGSSRKKGSQSVSRAPEMRLGSNPSSPLPATLQSLSSNFQFHWGPRSEIFSLSYLRSFFSEFFQVGKRVPTFCVGEDTE